MAAKNRAVSVVVHLTKEQANALAPLFLQAADNTDPKTSAQKDSVAK